MRNTLLIVSAILFFVVVGPIILPAAWQSWEQLRAPDDPAVQVQAGLRIALTPERLRTEMQAALSADDIDMAASFIELAKQEHMEVPEDLQERYADATTHLSSIRRVAVSGCIEGEGNGAAEMSGVIVCDLSGYGDLRDLVIEARKQSPDPVVLGLAAAGLGVTAAVWGTAGVATPARVGVSIFKVAARAGRLSRPLAAHIGATLEKAVSLGALKEAAVHLDLTGVKTAASKVVKAEELSGIISLGEDVGTLSETAGVRGAQVTLAVARTSGDIERVGQLAKTRKGATAAILKVLGIGGLVLSGAFGIAAALAGWVAAGIGYLWMLGIFVAALVKWIVRAVWQSTHRGRLKGNDSERNASAGTSGRAADGTISSQFKRILMARRLSFAVGAILTVSVAAILSTSTNPTSLALAQPVDTAPAAMQPIVGQGALLQFGLFLFSVVAQCVTGRYVIKSFDAVAKSDSVRSNPALAIQLLDNIDTVLDLPLYVGIFLTVLGLFLTILFGSAGSYGAYGATMIGLGVTAGIRVWKVTPLRRLLIEATHASTVSQPVSHLAAPDADV